MYNKKFVENPIFSYNSSEIMCCKYNASLNCVAGGYTDGTVKLYSSMDGELLSTFTNNEKAQSPVTDVQYQPLRSDRPATNSFLCSCIQQLSKLNNNLVEYLL